MNDFISNVDILNGLNINPIPLEFSNSLTTTKWLCEMQAKLTSVITAVNGWYGTISADLQNGGLLYQRLEEHFDSEFAQNIANLQSTIDAITAIVQVPPIVTLLTTPSKLVYAVGETINGIILNFNVVKGNNDLVKAEVYKNGVLLSTINSVTNGANSFSDSNTITFDTEYYIKIIDVKNNTISNSIKYQFTNNVYVGVVADNTNITNGVIVGLTPLPMLKGEIDYNFSPNNQKILIAYPASYGLLTSLQDINNFELLPSFSKSTLTVTIGTNIPLLYNIYIIDTVLVGSNIELFCKF